MPIIGWKVHINMSDITTVKWLVLPFASLDRHEKLSLRFACGRNLPVTDGAAMRL